MKRYGDNLSSASLEDLDHDSDKPAQYLSGNCAVRQDIVAFLLASNPPEVSKTREHKVGNVFSFFRIGQEKTQENGD